MKGDELTPSPIDVTPVFTGKLARNRGLVPGDRDARIGVRYGVTATLLDDHIDFRLTLLNGVAYCCGEYGCHLDMLDDRRWQWLREGLASDGVPVPQGLMTARIQVIVEAGALFFDFARPHARIPGRGPWYDFAPALAPRQYELTVHEGAVLSGYSQWVDRKRANKAGEQS